MSSSHGSKLGNTEAARAARAARTDAAPGYGQVWQITDGPIVVILGNCTFDDNTIWSADVKTGERLDPSVDALLPVDADLTLQEVAAMCRAWARLGNSDAAWWLGHYYEYGGDDGQGDGQKALAYYVAACRLEPEHGRATGWRPYGDRLNMFTMGALDERRKALALSVIARFPEFDAPIRTYHRPDLDWRDAIAIAEEDAAK